MRRGRRWRGWWQVGGRKDAHLCQVENAIVAWQHDGDVPTSDAVTVEGKGTDLIRGHLIVNAACLGGG